MIHADIEVEGVVYNTYLCASEDFKKRGESKIALDDYYRTNAEKAESHYDFCVRKGWQEYVNQMIAVDYLILNRDRHGANIEILRNARAHTLRIAPLFDHGLSLLYSCMSDEAAGKFNPMEDKRCQNFIGSYSCYENLKYLKGKGDVFENKLRENESIDLPAWLLYDEESNIPLNLNDFKVFLKNNVLDTTESCDLLECSRQNMSYMVRKQQLTPVKEEVRGNLYLKGDVLRTLW